MAGMNLLMRSTRLQLLVTLLATLLAAGLLIHRGLPPSRDIFDACQADDVTQGRRAARWGTVYNNYGKDYSGRTYWTALSLVVYAADADAVKWLLDCGVDPSIPNADDTTPVSMIRSVRGEGLFFPASIPTIFNLPEEERKAMLEMLLTAGAEDRPAFWPLADAFALERLPLRLPLTPDAP